MEQKSSSSTFFCLIAQTFELLLSILLLAVPAPLVNFGSAETEALGNGVDSHSGPVGIDKVLLLEHLHLCLG